MTIGQNAIGADFTAVQTLGTAVNVFPEFELGTRMKSGDGSEYIFVQANGAITANDVCVIDEAFQADQLDLTNSAATFQQAVGVAPATFADNDYGWMQIYGACTINVGTGAGVNAQLNSTSTAGRVDDDAGVGSEDIEGLATTAAESGNAAAAWIAYARVGVTN